jgi:hypothetical protein
MKYTSMNESNTIRNLMKGLLFTGLIFSMITVVNVEKSTAQEVNFNTGLDFYSTYVFRGVAFSGPSVQPYLELEAGNFTIGGWGSQGYDGFQEMDLYASYDFDFGLSIGITDYYYPGSDYFDGDSHAFEMNSGLDLGTLSLSANMVLNEAPGAGSAGVISILKRVCHWVQPISSLEPVMDGTPWTVSSTW